MKNKRSYPKDVQLALTRGKLVVTERLLQQAAKLIRLAYQELTP